MEGQLFDLTLIQEVPSFSLHVPTLYLSSSSHSSSFVGETDSQWPAETQQTSASSSSSSSIAQLPTTAFSTQPVAPTSYLSSPSLPSLFQHLTTQIQTTNNNHKNSSYNAPNYPPSVSSSVFSLQYQHQLQLSLQFFSTQQQYQQQHPNQMLPATEGPLPEGGQLLNSNEGEEQPSDFFNHLHFLESINPSSASGSTLSSSSAFSVPNTHFLEEEQDFNNQHFPLAGFYFSAQTVYGEMALPITSLEVTSTSSLNDVGGTEEINPVPTTRKRGRRTQTRSRGKKEDEKTVTPPPLSPKMSPVSSPFSYESHQTKRRRTTPTVQKVKQSPSTSPPASPSPSSATPLSTDRANKLGRAMSFSNVEDLQKGKLDKVRLASVLLSFLPHLAWQKQKGGVFFQLLPSFRQLFGGKIVSETDISRGYSNLVKEFLEVEFKAVGLDVPSCFWPKESLLQKLVAHVETYLPGLDLEEGLSHLYSPSPDRRKSKAKKDESFSSLLHYSTINVSNQRRGNQLLLLGHGDFEIDTSKTYLTPLTTRNHFDSVSEAVRKITKKGPYSLVVLHDSVFTLEMAHFDKIFRAIMSQLKERAALHVMSDQESEGSGERSDNLLVFTNPTEKRETTTPKRQKTSKKQSGLSFVVSKIIEAGLVVDNSSPMLGEIKKNTRLATKRYVDWVKVMMRAVRKHQEYNNFSSSLLTQSQLKMLLAFINILKHFLLIPHCNLALTVLEEDSELLKTLPNSNMLGQKQESKKGLGGITIAPDLHLQLSGLWEDLLKGRCH